MKGNKLLFLLKKSLIMEVGSNAVRHERVFRDTSNLFLELEEGHCAQATLNCSLSLRVQTHAFAKLLDKACHLLRHVLD